MIREKDISDCAVDLSFSVNNTNAEMRSDLDYDISIIPSIIIFFWKVRDLQFFQFFRQYHYRQEY